jgi:hypothetical protein
VKVFSSVLHFLYVTSLKEVYPGVGGQPTITSDYVYNRIGNRANLTTNAGAGAVTTSSMLHFSYVPRLYYHYPVEGD